MTILVAGDNEHKQITPTSDRVIDQVSPTVTDFSDVVSYSVYKHFAVIVLNSGIPCAIGDNTNWPIHSSLPRYVRNWTSYTLTDDENREYFIESAVCGLSYTLYKLRLKDEGSESRLALVYKGKMKGLPVFLNTGNWIPMSIYGGGNVAASIDEKGAIHIINSSIFNDENYSTRVLFLPNNDLPISVCFCDDFVFAISGQKVLYELNLSEDKREFQRNQELNNISVKSISGITNHCIALTVNGEVYVRGSNKYGQLGVGNSLSKSKNFIKLRSLENKKIDAAFAGCFHSLFIDENDNVLACGNNKFGELLTNKNINEIVYRPIVTSVKSNTKFCIVGSNVSVVFVDHSVPQNSPNLALQLISPYPYPQLFVKKENKNEDLKNEINEKNEVNELLQEIVNTQIEEIMRLNKKCNKMKKLLESLEIDFNSDDQSDDEINTNTTIEKRKSSSNDEDETKSVQNGNDKEKSIHNNDDDDDIEYVDDDDEIEIKNQKKDIKRNENVKGNDKNIFVKATKASQIKNDDDDIQFIENKNESNQKEIDGNSDRGQIVQKNTKNTDDIDDDIEYVDDDEATDEEEDNDDNDIDIDYKPKDKKNENKHYIDKKEIEKDVEKSEDSEQYDDDDYDDNSAYFNE